MCAAWSSRAKCATFGARAKCARSRDSTHRETCRPPSSLSKPLHSRGGRAIMVSAGPAHSR
eukprot:5121591-Pyramimonas_sp.AAC.1